MFVPLTEQNGSVVYVNLNLVTHVREFSENGYTILYIGEKALVTVNETVAEINRITKNKNQGYAL